MPNLTYLSVYLRLDVLGGADFRWARLNGVKLNGAKYNETTRFPKKVDPEQEGAIKEKL